MGSDDVDLEVQHLENNNDLDPFLLPTTTDNINGDESLLLDRNGNNNIINNNNNNKNTNGRHRHDHHHHHYHRKSSVLYGGDEVVELMKESGGFRHGCCLVLPWSKTYRCWWNVTVMGAIITSFFLPYRLAFETTPGTLQPFTDVFDFIELLLEGIFVIDIIINCNLATFCQDNELLVVNKRQIRNIYIHQTKMFYVDFIGYV